MTQSFKLPDLGEGIHEGEVTAVTVSVGDAVKEGDIILEIETDKAAVEIPSPITGTVTEIRVKAGDVVNVGDVLMSFETSGDAAGAVPPETPLRAEQTDVETAPSDSVSETAEAASGDSTEKQEAASRKAPKEKPPAETPAADARRTQPVPAAPATRRLAREMGVDLHAVTPTGRGGVVTADDLRAFADKSERAADAATDAGEDRLQKPAAPTPARSDPGTGAPSRPLDKDAPPLPDFSRWGQTDRVPVRSIRRATARHMAESWSRIPHVTTTDTVDITDLEAFRQKHKRKIADAGGRLTLTVFVMKAVVAALKRFPNFNASLDAAADELVLKHYYHIGVAVDTDDGLIVPVMRDVDRKSITELAVDLKAMVQKTHERKTGVEELQGGTFTITNTGSTGGALFVPIINTPQAAILGMGRASLAPVVRTLPSGRHEIVPRFMMPIILTMDHRILDGGDASRFLAVVTGALGDPEELMLTMV